MPYQIVKKTKRPFSEKEKNFILENKDTLTLDEICENLNRKQSKVTELCKRLSVCIKNKHRYIVDGNIAILHITDSNGFCHKVYIDLEMLEDINSISWTVYLDHNIYYAKAMINNKHVFMHKFITGYNITDHIDGNGLNNVKTNLQNVNNSQNAENTSRTRGIVKLRGVNIENGAYRIRLRRKQNNKKAIVVFEHIMSIDSEYSEVEKVCNYAIAYGFKNSPQSRTISEVEIPEWIKTQIDKRRDGCFYKDIVATNKDGNVIVFNQRERATIGKKLGIESTNMSACLNGRIKSIKGWTFEYVEDNK